MTSGTPLYRLKRKAREASRNEKIPLHSALDRIAGEEGYKSWSLLAATTQQQEPAAREIYRQLKPSELLLTGARPGQGKTLLSLQLAIEAIREGHRAWFFSLEYTVRDVMDRLAALGVEPQSLRDRFIFDDSDDICAGYVIERLADAPTDTLAVIDYLQLLDQRRDKPDLARQVEALRDFARQKRLILVFISQIDRSFDPSSKALPGLGDVRLPNPLDLGLFDKACFINAGEMRLVAA